MDKRSLLRYPYAGHLEFAAPHPAPGVEHNTEWMTLEDGHEALIVDGGGLDGGDGSYFANAGEECPRSEGWPR